MSVQSSARTRRASTPRAVPAGSPDRTSVLQRALPATRPLEPIATVGDGRSWLLIALLAVAVTSLVYLLQTTGVASAGYDIQRLQVERSDWFLRNEQLKLELAKLRSVTWLESEAARRLGMQKPASLIYLPRSPAQTEDGRVSEDSAAKRP